MLLRDIYFAKPKIKKYLTISLVLKSFSVVPGTEDVKH